MFNNNRPFAYITGSILLLAFTVLIVAAQSSTKSDFPLGSFQDGDFIADFTPDGELIVRGDGFIKAKAFYKVDGDQITIMDKDARGECRGEGRYKWRYEGKALRFTKIEDECRGRVHHLTTRAWPKVKRDK